MKTYSQMVLNEELKNELETELTKTLFGIKAVSKRYGEGTITTVEIAEIEEDSKEANLIITINFGEISKAFMLRTILTIGSVEFEDTSKLEKALEDLQLLINEKSIEADKEVLAIKETEQKAREAEALELKRQKDELKFKLKKDKMLEKLATLKPENTKKLFETPTSHYEVLGWMAKHVTSVRAAMPDWMENQFVSMFGDVERYVVDSKKKTSGGFDYQWGLGLKISFDKEVAGPLEKRATSKNKKVIDSLTFVWDLIDNYGFTFGKKQDLDKIIDEVPDQYLADFQRGYAM